MTTHFDMIGYFRQFTKQNKTFLFKFSFEQREEY
jgi:hypothetical protein